jgi:hypothetical protein
LLKARGPLNCPRLLRGVEGDFVAQVRVGGNVSTPPGVHGYRRAGLILTAGVTGIGVYRVTSGVVEEKALGRTHVPPLCFDTARGLGVTRYFLGGPDLGKPAYLRLERRGNRLDVAFSLEGRKWTSAWTEISDLPRKLKVGVFAEATAPGTFKAEFDHFRLSGSPG